MVRCARTGAGLPIWFRWASTRWGRREGGRYGRGVQAPSRGPVRLVRAGILGAVAFLLAAGAHLAGGGGLPGLPVLVFLALMTAPILLWVTARRCRLPRVLTALGVEQVLLHAAFSVTTGAAACGDAARVTATGHHTVAMTVVPCHLVGPSGAGPMPAGGLSSGVMAHAMGSWPMLVAHVVATLLTAVVLARGEAALWALADRVVPRSVPFVAPLRVEAHLVAPGAAVLGPVLSWWADGSSPRGPPARVVPGFA